MIRRTSPFPGKMPGPRPISAICDELHAGPGGLLGAIRATRPLSPTHPTQSRPLMARNTHQPAHAQAVGDILATFAATQNPKAA